MSHQSVMVEEAMEYLSVRRGGTYVDGTAGSGGHARAVLERAGAEGCVLAIDRDREALERTARTLEGVGGRAVLRHGNFGDIEKHAAEAGISAVDGVLLDLGVSSDQLDTAERGFSFMKDGPLDMRMDFSAGATAEDLVNSMSESELRETIMAFGEEKHAARIARAIVSARQSRPIRTTLELAGVIERATGGRRERIHPATRTFQALRMAVNGELDDVRRGLDGSMRILRDGGRLAVISFHSLEDRLVKQFMAAHAGRWVAQQAGGEEWVGELPPAEVLTRHPVTPSAAEREANPRARSAKLRALERSARPFRQTRGSGS